MLLSVERSRTHVADVESIDALDLCVLDRFLNRLGRQVLEGFPPMLGHGSLAYSNNGYISHVCLE